MIRKTGPDLLRQTLTRLWFFNFYVQKPYNLGLNFLYIFKLLYLVNIFLGCFRPLRKNTYVSQITHQLKKNTHRLIEISTYKFITFRINYQNRVLNLYINITSRKTMYPIKPQTFEFTQLFMLFKKKMKVFDYSHTIIKKNKYSNFLNTKIKSNKIFKKSQKQSIRFQNSEKNKKTLVLILQEKKKNRKKNINTKKFIKHSTINVFFLKTIKNNIFIINNHTKLRRILLRSLKKKKKIINSENVSYFFRYSKNKTTKISILEFLPTQVFKFFAKTYVRNQFKKFKINKIFQGLIRKKKNQNFKYFLWYSNLKNIKNKINIFLHRNTPNFLFLNDDFTSSIKKKRNIETDWIYNWKKMAISTNKYSYIYLQIFNQFLNFKLNKFLFFLIKKKYYKLFLKQEFILPKSNSKLQKFEKNVLRTTKFLKAKNRFYYNFLNLIPSLENFIIAQQLVNQIAAELARTKKHWKVIRGLHLLLIQSYTEMRKNPININSCIKGIQIKIKGRPNKISRTKQIILNFGIVSKASYSFANVTKTFSKANAQIGSFGIQILLVT